MSCPWSILFPSRNNLLPFCYWKILKIYIGKYWLIRFLNFLRHCQDRVCLIHNRRWHDLILKLNSINVVSFRSIKTSNYEKVRIHIHCRLMKSPLTRSISNRYYPRPCGGLIYELINIIKAFLLLIYPSKDIHCIIVTNSCVTIPTLN